MKITDIAPRRHRLSQLYIDGEAAVKVDTETLLRRGIAIGDELDDEELHALLQASAKHRAEEKALYLLEHRAHSKKELENKITRAEFDREAARSAVEHMEELGLLNDEDYARRLAALRLRFRRDLLCLKFRRMTVKRRCFGCRAVLCVARDGQGVQKRHDFRTASVFLRV